MPGRELRVNTAVLASVGQELSTAADAIPAAPTPATPTGEDPLSTAIAVRVNKDVVPVIAARPGVKEDATGYARALPTAGHSYDASDKLLSNRIHQEVSGGISSPGTAASVGAGTAVPSAGGSAPSVSGAGAAQPTGVVPGASLAGATAGPLGGSSQMARLPTQMLSQAGRAPMQMGAALPREVMRAARAGHNR